MPAASSCSKLAHRVENSFFLRSAQAESAAQPLCPWPQARKTGVSHIIGVRCFNSVWFVSYSSHRSKGSRGQLKGRVATLATWERYRGAVIRERNKSISGAKRGTRRISRQVEVRTSPLS